MGETALITGCSSGIGRAATRTFLEDGWNVTATARDRAALADLEAAGATTARLDVTADADVERVVDACIDEYGQIDCLVNNAGFGQMGPLEDVSSDAVREQYDVNVFGPHRLMRAALPHMRERGVGTILNVTSITARFPVAGSAAYSGSKAALAAASCAVRQEVRTSGIDVVIVEPTAVATGFYDRVRDELVDLDHAAAYTDLYEVLEFLHTTRSGGFGITPPETVAETMLEAANSDAPRARYQVGWPSKAGTVVATVLPESWQTVAMEAGVRAAASRPGKWLLQWWFARHHRVGDDGEDDHERPWRRTASSEEEGP